MGSEKALMTVKEFCSYLGIGQTQARQILNNPFCDFSFRIGSRLYANREKLDHRLHCYETLL